MLLCKDVDSIVRALDNVVDRAIYPLKEQEIQAKNKRRMGLGITGLANTLEILGMQYGSDKSVSFTRDILAAIRDTAYNTSIDMAKEKGSFPVLNRELFLKSEFAMTLPGYIREQIMDHGIRNSHLLSIAPTGTISLAADNVSSGLEPPYTWEYSRTIQTFDGPMTTKVSDYAYREYGIKGKTADQVSVDEHVNMLNVCSQYVDSAVSKTCNVGDSVSYEEFKEIYMKAYLGGSSGCTTFRASGKRFGILNATIDDTGGEQKAEGQACTFDLETGRKTCE